MAELTQQLVQDLYRYDEETGKFFQKKARKGVRVGAETGILLSDGYVHLSVLKVRVPAHRIAWLYVNGSMPAGQIDHINGVRSDNRICNLRDVMQSTNMQNRRAPDKGKATQSPLGVHYENRTGKWVAQITKTMPDGKRLNRKLGRFETAEMAHMAYVSAKRSWHEGCTI